MRILSNISNVEAPDSDYPKGRIRNKNLISGESGTPVVEEVYGDIIQFFQRIAELVEVTENDLPDNVTNGHQLIEAFKDFIKSQATMQWDNMTFIEVGSDLVISGAATAMMLCAINDTDIVWGDYTNKELRTYRFNNGRGWTQVGSSFGIASMTDTYSCGKLADNTIVMANRADDNIRVYSFNGSTWSAVGSALTWSSVAGAFCYLSSNHVAFLDDNTNTLNTLIWNGSTLAIEGNQLSLGSISVPMITYLEDNLIAVTLDISNTTYIRTYQWNGTDWIQVGNSFSLGVLGSSTTAIVGHGSDDITIFDSLQNYYRAFRFDGTDWIEYGIALYQSSSGGSREDMTVLGNGIIVRMDAPNDTIKSVARIPILK
jgi:hypothetical protein